MSELLYLAQGGGFPDHLWLVTLKVLALGYALYLIAQLLRSIPFLTDFMNGNIGRMIILVLILGLSIALMWLLPGMRILHELKLIKSAKALVWLDIIFSGLALAQLSFLYPPFFEWVKSRNI